MRQILLLGSKHHVTWALFFLFFLSFCIIFAIAALYHSHCHCPHQKCYMEKRVNVFVFTFMGDTEYCLSHDLIVSVYSILIRSRFESFSCVDVDACAGEGERKNAAPPFLPLLRAAEAVEESWRTKNKTEEREKWE